MARCMMKDDLRIKSLKKTALFSSLPSDELHRVLGNIVIKNFKKNEIILHEENTSEFINALEKQIPQVGGMRKVPIRGASPGWRRS